MIGIEQTHEPDAPKNRPTGYEYRKTLTGYYNNPRGASRLSRHGTDGNVV